MNRKLVLAALLSVWNAMGGASTLTAAEKTIEAIAPMAWSPADIKATVGDVVEWKMGADKPGSHGVRIMNWAAVKDHVEVEMVAGQHPFDAKAGQTPEDNPTNTPGKVLLRLKIKTAPPAAINFNCIVHGKFMKGTVSIAAAVPTAVLTIEAKAPMAWNPAEIKATVGDVVEWKMGADKPGSHGVRIMNWAAVKDHVEVEMVAGQHPFDAKAGQTPEDNPTNTPGKVLLRLKIKTAPPAAINFNCIVHGKFMKGTVSVGVAKDAKDKKNDKEEGNKKSGVDKVDKDKKTEAGVELRQMNAVWAPWGRSATIECRD